MVVLAFFIYNLLERERESGIKLLERERERERDWFFETRLLEREREEILERDVAEEEVEAIGGAEEIFPTVIPLSMIPLSILPLFFFDLLLVLSFIFRFFLRFLSSSQWFITRSWSPRYHRQLFPSKVYLFNVCSNWICLCLGLTLMISNWICVLNWRFCEENFEEFQYEASESFIILVSFVSKFLFMCFALRYGNLARTQHI